MIYKVFRKIKLEISQDAVLAWTAIILFGASLRLLEDQGTISRFDAFGYMFVTPGIWLIIAGVGLSITLIAHLIYKKTKWFKNKKEPYRFVFIIGLLISTPILFWIKFKNPIGMLSIFGLVAFTMSIYLIAGRFFKVKFLKNKTNLLLIFGQLLDGYATYISVDFYGYGEQHVVGTQLISWANSAFVFMIVKAVYITVIVYLLDKWIKNKEALNMIKIVLLTLGMGPGLRDTLRLGAMV